MLVGCSFAECSRPWQSTTHTCCLLLASVTVPAASVIGVVCGVDTARQVDSILCQPRCCCQSTNDQALVVTHHHLSLSLAVTVLCLLVQKVEDPVELWSIASRACSKRYLLMMAKLWHRASVPEDRIAMDSYVLHAAQDLPDQAPGPVEDALAVQPTQ